MGSHSGLLPQSTLHTSGCQVHLKGHYLRCWQNGFLKSSGQRLRGNLRSIPGLHPSLLPWVLLMPTVCRALPSSTAFSTAPHPCLSCQPSSPPKRGITQEWLPWTQPPWTLDKPMSLPHGTHRLIHTTTSGGHHCMESPVSGPSHRAERGCSGAHTLTPQEPLPHHYLLLHTVGQGVPAHAQCGSQRGNLLRAVHLHLPLPQLPEPSPALQ